MKSLWLGAVLLWAVNWVFAEVSQNASEGRLKLPAIFGDHMVLQCNMPVPIWGWAKPNEEVAVILKGKTPLVTKANEEGRWMLRLPPQPAGGPHELIVRTREETVRFTDVLFGEVWVCSGQSNMEWPVALAQNAKQEIATANFPQIRFFVVEKSVALEPQPDCKGRWVVCSPETVGGFSAVGYFFGREIHQRLKVPVGLIGTYWGGTPAEAWTDLKALESDPDLKPILERLPRDRSKIPQQPQPPINNWTPTALFNAMVAPIIPYAIRGVIWYQGESNVGRAYQYRKLFPALINSWRRAWGQGDFPFLFVQLANYLERKPEPTESAWAELREAQLLTFKTVRNTGMAVAIDIGEANDIHPRNKQDVGKRLALAALAIAYGQKVVYSGPIYRSMRIEGDKIRLFFDHVGSGLVAKGGELKGFAIAGEDRKFVWAKAKIEGNTVVVWSEQVPKPVAVRYAWADNPECNLYNKEGLPASPFRTDDWPGVTVKNL